MANNKSDGISKLCDSRLTLGKASLQIGYILFNIQQLLLVIVGVPVAVVLLVLAHRRVDQVRGNESPRFVIGRFVGNLKQDDDLRGRRQRAH